MPLYFLIFVYMITINYHHYEYYTNFIYPFDDRIILEIPQGIQYSLNTIFNFMKYFLNIGLQSLNI